MRTLVIESRGRPRTADSARHRHRERTDREEPEEGAGRERDLIDPDVSEVAEQSATGDSEEGEADRSQQRGDRHLRECGGNRKGLERALLSQRHPGRGTDDQQRHPYRPERWGRRGGQNRQRGDVAAEHRERAERREADMGARSDRHRRSAHHQIG